MMTTNRVSSTKMPHWLLQTVRMMGHVEGGVSDIETELRDARDLPGLDPRLRRDLVHLLDVLGGVKVSLAVAYMTANKLLQESGTGEASDPDPSVP